MDNRALVQMLLAMRAQIEAMHAEINAALFALVGPPAEPGEPPTCDHPPESRLNLTTMGGPVSWQCRLCGYTHVDP